MSLDQIDPAVPYVIIAVAIVGALLMYFYRDPIDRFLDSRLFRIIITIFGVVAVFVGATIGWVVIVPKYNTWYEMTRIEDAQRAVIREATNRHWDRCLSGWRSTSPLDTDCGDVVREMQAAEAHEQEQNKD